MTSHEKEEELEKEGPKQSPTDTTDTTSHDDGSCSSVNLIDDDDEQDDGEGEEIVLTATGVVASAEPSQQQTTTQKRFSFYDAQEVQLQYNSSVPSHGSQSSSADNNKNLQNRYGFYDPALLVVDVNSNQQQPNKGVHSNINSNNNVVVGAATEEQSGIRISATAPKMASCTTSSSTSSAAAHRQRHGEEEVENKLPPLLTDPYSLQSHHGHNSMMHDSHSNSSTDEILRSLQETEEQRMQILQPTSYIAGTNNSQSSSSFTGLVTNHMASSGHNNTNVATTSTYNNNNNNLYEDAIREALDLLRKHRSPPPSPSVTGLANNASINVHHQQQPWDGLLRDADDNDNRTPREQDHIVKQRREINGNDDDNDNDDVEEHRRQQELLLFRSAGVVTDDTVNASASTTIDLVDTPQTTTSPDNSSLTDALQEAKLKAKQRQERMAEYANRLQEFKSTLPPEQQMPTSQQNNNNSSPQQYQHAAATTSSTAQLPHQIQPNILSSSLHDGDSVGLISDMSQSTRQQHQQPSFYSQYQSNNHQQQQYNTDNLNDSYNSAMEMNSVAYTQRIVEEEVQKGVEKVLLAILEASKSTSSHHSRTIDHASTNSSSGNVSEALLRAMDEVLHHGNSRTTMTTTTTTQHYSNGAVHTSGNDTASNYSRGDNNDHYSGPMLRSTLSGTSKQSITSGKSQESYRSKRSGGERSVVDELLAEADHEEFMLRQRIPTSSLHDWSHREEKKMTDNDKMYGQSTSAPHDTTAKALLKKSTTPVDITERSEEATDDYDEENEDDTEDDEMNSDLEDDDDESYDEDDDEEETDGDDDSHAEEEVASGRVLGPLSRNAGGTTGVVLDSESESIKNDRGKVSRGYFSSVVNYVTSALTPDQQRKLDAKRAKQIDPGSLDIDDPAVHDLEAMELMRTLCAHLLPFGVDRKSNLEEFIPAWDEDNPNEAGYRIIRMSRSQLRRVEKAFDAMITGLKSKSQSQLNIMEGEYDADFIRELKEAERLLDDVEKKNSVDDTKKQENLKSDLPAHSAVVELKHIGSHDSAESINTCAHPDFPGVKGAGKGEMGDLEYFQLPIIFKSHVTGFEPTKDMVLEPGNVIAGQYLVESELGSAAFSTAYRCIDLSSEDNDGHEEVCLKVIKNTKDFFDQSLDEIKILELLRKTGKCDENYIVRMKTFFYYREHLIIVTELLRQNLFEFGKFILDNDEEPYFTLPRLAFITRQCLLALRFVHSLGLVHSDVKPENILLGSYSRAQVKLIDFGSSCYLTDRQSSYIQSRSYRAPEVVLGLPYDGKIDVWSLGCVVAEMYTGEVTFQNDSIVSMLSRIEAICGSFPRHMIAQGRQSGRFFTKSGLLYEVVDDSDNESEKNPPGPNDEAGHNDADANVQFDIFQPKNTRLSSRLGFDTDLMDNFNMEGLKNKKKFSERQKQQLFTDFVARLLTIDPDGRPTADEALQHPWMKFASSLTEEMLKYPGS